MDRDGQIKNTPAYYIICPFPYSKENGQKLVSLFKPVK
jgi:hypothetical protein